MKKYLLLIDDDNEDHDVFVQQLSLYNPDIEVLSAFNGKQGLDILSKKTPDWIFLDINMPGMNGIDVLTKIKKIPPIRDIPVIIYSTSDGFNSKPVALKLGAMQYFRKPNSPKGFTNIFREVFRD